MNEEIGENGRRVEAEVQERERTGESGRASERASERQR